MKNPDLISREAAIQAINRYDYRGFTVEDVKIVTDGCAEELRKLPSIEAEPVRRGSWERKGTYIYCTYCKSFFKSVHCGPNIFKFRRCPYCGAKMGGGDRNGNQADSV